MSVYKAHFCWQSTYLNLFRQNHSQKQAQRPLLGPTVAAFLFKVQTVKSVHPQLLRASERNDPAVQFVSISVTVIAANWALGVGVLANKLKQQWINIK